MDQTSLRPETEAAIHAQIKRHEELASRWRYLLAVLQRPTSNVEKSDTADQPQCAE